MNSDDSAIFQESESPSLNPQGEDSDLDELYKHIPPPIPLIPKNKYKELPIHLQIRPNSEEKFFKRFMDSYKGDNMHSYDKSTNRKEGMVSLANVCENTNIVYQRDLTKSGNPSNSNKTKLDNLSSLPKLDHKFAVENKTDTLIFESRFESGNLALAIKITDVEYELLMQNDINTKGHTQWFYFGVSIFTKKSVKFTILNFSKKDSLFNAGMEVLVHSSKMHKANNAGWYRSGRDISYFANNISRNNSTFYSLTFTFDFPHDSDIVYFAYCYPYTYSELTKDLEFLQARNADILKRKVLCVSLCEKPCEVVTITAPGTAEEIKNRKGAVISARVHPGETVGSWMMKGLLEFLVSHTPEAKMLREKYVFKIVPMLNPDGVIYGNYRCGLAGSDLNRNWKSPSKLLHPTIYFMKKLIKAFHKERTVDFICDFHGHSKKKNIFMYGCNIAENPEITRTIPFIISKISQYFYYPSCSFRMQKSKEATLRLSVFRETKIPLVYTLEASFFGGSYVIYM